MGAGLEVLLPSESLRAASTLGRLDFGCKVDALRRPSGDVEEALVEASELSVFFSAFQLLPAPPTVVLAEPFMTDATNLESKLLKDRYVNGGRLL